MSLVKFDTIFTFEFDPGIPNNKLVDYNKNFV